MSRDPLALELLSLSTTHQLCQPLSLIVGYAELLAARTLPEAERAAALATIRRAATHLAGSFERLEHADGTGRIRFGSGVDRDLLDLRADPTDPNRLDPDRDGGCLREQHGGAG